MKHSSEASGKPTGARQLKKRMLPACNTCVMVPPLTMLKMTAPQEARQASARIDQKTTYVPFRLLPSRPTSLSKLAGALSNKLSDEHDAGAAAEEENLDFNGDLITARGAAPRNGSIKEGRDRQEKASSCAQREAMHLLFFPSSCRPR